MNTETRYLADIAVDIYDAIEEQYGAQRPNWWAYAKPYVDALSTLASIHDNYYYDSAQSVVAYLLANLTYWRGDTARTIKAELNEILKSA